MDEEDLVAWVRLARSLPVGSRIFTMLRKLQQKPEAMLAALPRMSENSTANILVCARESALREIEATRNLGAKIIVFDDPCYPHILRHIRCPPPIITVIGDAQMLSRRAVAVVGSRSASMSGLKFASGLCAKIVEAGYVVVSGLARGVDTAAHQAARVDGSFATVAVMASGIDVVYPKTNRNLYREIVSGGGAVITESAFGTAPKGYLFPQRNRIISALSLGVIVVEASVTSGSLITARYALSQGREVFAVPGFPADQRYGGNSRLLKEGAILVESADDVIEALENFSLDKPVFPHKLSEEAVCFAPGFSIGGDPVHEESIKGAILGALGSTPIDLEEVIEVLKAGEHDEVAIMESLLQLEIDDKIERSPGNKIALIFGA